MFLIVFVFSLEQNLISLKGSLSKFGSTLYVYIVDVFTSTRNYQRFLRTVEIHVVQDIFNAQYFQYKCEQIVV